ncbi:hypothetical protein [Paenibacillus illinoisensis]|uniref:hypothetical protein n=1 Tax=Paenibacillus illinoisensis TaxID=59845 RepID=UPI00301E0E6A
MKDYKYRLIDAEIGGFAKILYDDKEEITFGPLAKIELVKLRHGRGVEVGYSTGKSFLRLTDIENNTLQNDFDFTEVRTLLDEKSVNYSEIDEPTTK